MSGPIIKIKIAQWADELSTDALGEMLSIITSVDHQKKTSRLTRGVPKINRRILYRTKPNNLDLSAHVNLSFGFLTAHKKFVTVLNNI